MYIREKDGVDIVDDFAYNCPNVTSLSVYDDGLAWPSREDEVGSAWVSRFGNKLTKIELNTETMHGIAKYCSSLGELNLYVHDHENGDDGFWE